VVEQFEIDVSASSNLLVSADNSKICLLASSSTLCSLVSSWETCSCPESSGSLSTGEIVSLSVVLCHYCVVNSEVSKTILRSATDDGN